MEIRLAVLTISDLGATGKRPDRSGDLIVGWAEEQGYSVRHRAVVPDESDLIAETLIRWADGGEVELILTTGGTGLGPRDVTPEATRAVIERDVPGISEALRAYRRSEFPRSSLSRAVSGIRGRALLINLPGSPGGVEDGLAAMSPFLEHAIEIITGQPTDH